VKLPLIEDNVMLKPIISALHVPAALQIVRRDGKLIATGMLPTQDLKEAVQAALSQPMHGLGVDVSKLSVSAHVLPAPLVAGEVIAPFLTSFYTT
jgi:hypothetical protein